MFYSEPVLEKVIPEVCLECKKKDNERTKWKLKEIRSAIDSFKSHVKFEN